MIKNHTLCIGACFNAFNIQCAHAQVATVNLTSIKQYIDGFGASTAFHGQISQN